MTDKRLIEKYGVFSVHCDEMQIDRIENITIEKDFWGKVFKYGDLCIQGTNRNNINFRYIKNPEIALKEINSVRNEMKA